VIISSRSADRSAELLSNTIALLICRISEFLYPAEALPRQTGRFDFVRSFDKHHVVEVGNPWGATAFTALRNREKVLNSNLVKIERSLLFFPLVATIALGAVQAQTSPPTNKTESDPRPIVVDKVLANPEKFKGPINVRGRVAKLGRSVGLFALSCEDECFSIPVRFPGTPPKPGSDVVVHGQLTKESNGRYVFNSKSVIPKK
jgi:hypothetical protein